MPRAPAPTSCGLLCERPPDYLSRVYSNGLLGPLFFILNIPNPVPLAPGEANLFALAIECHCGCSPQERRIDAVERIDADDSIEATVDAAGDHRRDATR